MATAKKKPAAKKTAASAKETAKKAATKKPAAAKSTAKKPVAKKVTATAKKAVAKAAPKKATAKSSTATKKSSATKSKRKPATPKGLFAKAKALIGEVVTGAASGAFQGAADAGSKAVGAEPEISAATAETGRKPAAKAKPKAAKKTAGKR